MKKNIWKLVALMFAVFTSMTMTSCSDDNKGTDEPKVLKVEATIGGLVNVELFDYFTFVRTYKEGNKVTEEEIATATATGEENFIEKKLKVVDISKTAVLTEPTNISVSYSVKLKEGVVIDKEIDLGIKKNFIKVTKTYSNGESVTIPYGEEVLYYYGGIYPADALRRVSEEILKLNTSANIAF